ncbi:RagB/SusD family nutrient uptake outer membrane protein [Gillisia sp. JM1]|uniref:RagB/SusD family nutrient uptake outer membrane protein n=1 Tax=Gillisia sp. JM1 TaxID=1283286 RepID=UPI0003FC91E1|nr:RagB/SusD family nutrient uptake outer membrane protein [Gillisia sp. JM1]
MKTLYKIKQVLVLLLFGFLTSCEDFLEIETPDNKITSEVVFDNDETAISAMTGIYNQLFNSPFSSGGHTSVTVLAGLSADALEPIRTTNLSYMEFEQHEILPDNNRNLNLWSSAYNIIYLTNSLIEGLSDSENISENLRFKLEGEAKFVRAFTYFYLVNLYGDVPLILSTDYQDNSLASRNSESEIYMQIIGDLQAAVEILSSGYDQGERTQVNQTAAIALLARVNLYLKNWEQAESLSSQVISQSNTYEILENLDKVFLANSMEAIWQLSPKGSGSVLTNTNDGASFLIHPFFSFLANLKIEHAFVFSINENDLRVQNWIGFHLGLEVYYANKYKIQNSTEPITEYSMVLRLAEQYLIRAEARAMQENLQGAIADLDVIRKRAGLDLLSEINPTITKENLLDKILEERRKELFTEWGHRWLDLKRTGKAGEILGAGDPLWQETDVLYPIPAAELMTNPNLTQNNGY